MLRKWRNQPKPQRAADIAQRLIALMLVSSGLLLFGVPPPYMGTLFELEQSFLHVRGYSVWSFIFGLILVFIWRPKGWLLVVLTSPILFFTFFTLLGLLRGTLVGVGFIFIALLYSTLLVLYWGAT